MLIVVEKPIPGVVEITINRPDKRNALNLELMTQLCETIEGLSANPEQRVLLIKGAGSVFCAGLDLAEAMDSTLTEHSAKLVARMLKAVYHCPLVTIAAVHGAALAGGAGLMTACDLVVADRNTIFGYPETQRGMVAALVMTFLVRQLGERTVRELLLLGELIDANKALALGMINRVTSQETLQSEAYVLAQQAMKGAPEATRKTKKLLETLQQRSIDDDIKLALDYHHEVRKSNEAREGMAAFLEKREPQWQQIF